ncbi:MAG: TolC family protein [Acidobacteriota bacterium]
MFNRRRFKLIVFLAVLLNGTVTASGVQQIVSAIPDSEGLTIGEAVREAILANPLVGAARAGERVAEARVSESKAGRLPFLQLEQTLMHSNNPVFVFGSLLEQEGFSSGYFDTGFLNDPPFMNNYRSLLNLKVPVFNKFKTSTAIEEARIGREQASADTEWTEQQIRFQVIRAFYGVHVAQAREVVAAETVKAAEKEAADIREMLEQGMAVKSDLLAMQVQLADFRQNLSQASGTVKTAKAALNTVLARPIDTPFQVAGQLESRAFLLPGEDELVKIALVSRPDYQKANHEISAMEQKIKAAGGQWWPDLNVFAQVGRSSRNITDGSSDFAIGAGLTFNILDFGRGARIEQARAGTDAVRAQAQYQANAIRLEIAQSYQMFNTSKERLEVASSAVAQAMEALRIVQDRHEAGLTTITEVLRAQTAMLGAKMNLLGAQYDLYLSFAKTKLAAGSLTGVEEMAS